MPSFNRTVLTALVLVIALLSTTAPATASSTAFDDRNTWRASAGGAGDVVDDLDAGSQAVVAGTSPAVRLAQRNHFTISGTAQNAFPNTNAATSIDGTGYLRSLLGTQGVPDSYTIFRFDHPIVAMGFDINPQSFNLGASITYAIDGVPGTFRLPASNTTEFRGFLSETPFTTFEIRSTNCPGSCGDNSGNAWHGIDNIEAVSEEVHDLTAPVVQDQITGTKGADGWYTSDVSVDWLISDGESAVTDEVGCDSRSVTTDTAGLELSCSATSAGGTTTVDVTIKRDATPPSIQPTRDVEGNQAGWANGPVTVRFECDDDLSGIATCTEPTTVQSDGTTTVQGRASDRAENAATVDTTIRIDSEAGTSTYNGSTLAFGLGIAPSGALSGTVTDATSGVAAVTVTLTPTQGGDDVVATAGLDCSTSTTAAPTDARQAANLDVGEASEATSCTWTLQDAPRGSWRLSTSAADVADNVEEPVDHGTVVIG